MKQVPIKPPLVYFTKPWHTTANGNIAAILNSPQGTFSLCIYQFGAGWNASVYGPHKYKQFAANGHESPLSYRAAREQLDEFVLSIAEHFESGKGIN